MAAQLFSDKGLLIIATVVGMALCSVGIGHVSARGEWLHPIAIISYVIGVLILIIVGTTLFNIQLPLIADPRTALVAMTALGIAKVVLTQLHRALAQY